VQWGTVGFPNGLRIVDPLAGLSYSVVRMTEPADVDPDSVRERGTGVLSVPCSVRLCELMRGPTHRRHYHEFCCVCAS